MKIKVLLTSIIGCALLMSCSKDEVYNEKIVKKSSDPVIDLYSNYGTVELADSSYEPMLDNCSNPYGIYLFVPDDGPFAGKITEIYRYLYEDDIDVACDDEFDKKQDVVEINGKTYMACPNNGSNCSVVQDEFGCLFIFCDEKTSLN